MTMMNIKKAEINGVDNAMKGFYWVKFEGIENEPTIGYNDGSVDSYYPNGQVCLSMPWCVIACDEYFRNDEIIVIKKIEELKSK